MTDRIKKILEESKLTQTQFAESLDINSSNITHIFSGRNQPSLELVKKILLSFPDISTEWLIFGSGNMKKNVAKVENDDALHMDPTKKRMIELDLFEQEQEVIQQRNFNDNNIINKKEPFNKTTLLNGDNASLEQTISQPKQEHVKRNDSLEDIKVEKIVFFLDNGRFEVYYPK